MSGFLAVLCFSLVFLQTSSAVDWNDFRVTFSAIDFFRLASFYKQPRTVAEAQQMDWSRPPETINNEKTITYCMDNDPRICIIYDLQGSVAGYQIGIPRVVDTLDQGINYTKAGFDKDTIFGKDMYVTRAYFVPQDVIASGGRNFNGQTGTGLWLKIDGQLKEIPNNECDLPAKIPLFVKQNCYSKMGQHYFYNIVNVTQQNFNPFFILYSETGELQGFGLVAFGSKAESKSFADRLPFFGKRGWFETLPSFAVRKVSPDSPDWTLNYIDRFGPYSHHVYFKQKPWNFGCERNVKCSTKL